MLTFSFFFEKRSFCNENDDKKTKTKRSLLVRVLKTVVFKTIVFQNDRFYKARRFVNDR